MDGYYDPSGTAAYLAVLLVLIPIILIFALAFYIIFAVFAMKIFEKAGVEGKWRAWVPVYNGMIMGKLGEVSPWVVLGAGVAAGLLNQIPVIGWIFSLVPVAVAVMYSWRIGLKFGKDWPLLLLWLIPGVGPLIWFGIMAFGSAHWNPQIAPAPWASTFLADKTVWSGIPVQPTAPAGPAPAAGGYAPPAPGAYPPPPAPGAYPPPPASATPPAQPPVPPAQPPVPPTEPPAAPEPPAEPPRA